MKTAQFLPENERPWLVCVKLHVPLFCVICELIALYVSWVAVFISALVIINELIFFLNSSFFSFRLVPQNFFSNFQILCFLKIFIYLKKIFFLNVRLWTDDKMNWILVFKIWFYERALRKRQRAPPPTTERVTPPLHYSQHQSLKKKWCRSQASNLKVE